MPAVEAPKSLLSKAAGWVLVEPGAYELQVFIREDRVNMGSYPHPCSVDIRLPTWDMPPTYRSSART